MAELREALENAITEAETAEDATVPSEVTESPAEETSSSSVEENSAVEENQPSDTDATEKSASPKEAEDAKPVSEDKSEAPPKGQHRIDRPPVSWKKEAKSTWNELPLNVRQEVYRREQQVTQVMQEAAQHRQQAEQFNQVIAPYQARFQQLGAQPVELIGRLLQSEYALATGNKQQTAQFMAKLIKDYDIDINALDAELSGSASPVQQSMPDVQGLVQQQIQQALAPILQEREAVRQQEVQQINETVESMSLNPEYPYFDDVRDDMADLIEMKAKKGIYLSLEDAYDMATKVNPDVSGQVQRQATMTSATQVHNQAIRARNAASSITGAPASAGSSGMVGDGSLRGSIEAAFGGARL